jgi:hypothetical protein
MKGLNKDLVFARGLRSKIHSAGAEGSIIIGVADFGRGEIFPPAPDIWSLPRNFGERTRTLRLGVQVV